MAKRYIAGPDGAEWAASLGAAPGALPGPYVDDKAARIQLSQQVVPQPQRAFFGVTAVSVAAAGFGIRIGGISGIPGASLVVPPGQKWRLLGFWCHGDYTGTGPTVNVLVEVELDWDLIDPTHAVDFQLCSQVGISGTNDYRISAHINHQDSSGYLFCNAWTGGSVADERSNPGPLGASWPSVAGMDFTFVQGGAGDVVDAQWLIEYMPEGLAWP